MSLKGGGKRAGKFDAVVSAEDREKKIPDWIIRIAPEGASKDIAIVGEDPLPGRVNYLVGKDPRRWRTDIPTFAHVVYKEVYPGVDMRFYGNNRQLEYDVIVKPGADVSSVKFLCEGVDELSLTTEGDLELRGVCSASGGDHHGSMRCLMLQRRPAIYQEIGGEKVEVEGRFEIVSRDPFIYAFNIPSYDKRHTLVIDPTLIYSTYLGGAGYDRGHGIAVDASGNAYVTGYAESEDFPVHLAEQPGNAGGEDVFISKINPAGNALVYSTYLGGSDDEWGWDIAVDPAGNAYVTGYTASTDFPVVNAKQAELAGGSDVFVAKINASGSALSYSTYLGGRTTDAAFGIAVDTLGCAYVTGVTLSSDFPVQSPIQAVYGVNGDGFVAKLSASGEALVYSTFLGGRSSDDGRDIAVDASGGACVVGRTSSTNFPVSTGAIQPEKAGGYDVFVTKINPMGNELSYSTYLGGAADDQGYGVALDSVGNVYATGYTVSEDFPVSNSTIQSEIAGGKDVFLSKINAAGDTLVYSTYLGGSLDESAWSTAVDASGGVYVTGFTLSGDFPLVLPLQPTHGGLRDGFVAKISAAGNALIYATYHGGSNTDEGYSVATDGAGGCYIVGYTESTDLYTTNAIQPVMNGLRDAFVAKIQDDEQPSWPSAYKSIFSDSSMLSYFRQYRDTFLINSNLGQYLVDWLYHNADDALIILCNNPEMIKDLNALFEANEEAVKSVLAGKEGVIYNTSDVTAFLDEFASVSPPSLRYLAIALRAVLLEKQWRGEKFFGLTLR